MNRLSPIQCEESLDLACDVVVAQLESGALVTNAMILANQMVMLEALRLILKEVHS